MHVKKILLYTGIFIVGFIGISLWNFYSVIRPSQITTVLTPADFNLSAEDISLETHDKRMLSAWFIPAPDIENTVNNKRALIIIHGYPAEKSDMLSIAASLYPDFSLLLLDLRSFGKSEGAYTTFGIKERDDIKRAVDFLNGRGYENIGIFGFSLGGAIGILTAAEDSRVGAVASYASFADLETLASGLYSNLFILEKPMTTLMLFWSRILFGASVTDISPFNAAQKLTIPTFIIHSEADEQIPFEHATLLQRALADNEKAEYYFLKDRRHGFLPNDFSERVKDFFARSFSM